MKKLLFIFLLIPFIFSCSDDKDDDSVTWDKNVVGLSFSGEVKDKYHLTILFTSDSKVNIKEIWTPKPNSSNTEEFDYSKNILPDNSVEITIHDSYRKGDDFVCVIDHTGKTMTYADNLSTTIKIKKVLVEIITNTVFYK